MSVSGNGLGLLLAKDLSQVMQKLNILGAIASFTVKHCDMCGRQVVQHVSVGMSSDKCGSINVCDWIWLWF